MDRTADTLACQDAVIAFCDATDSGDHVGQTACFTDDASMSPFPPINVTGKAELATMFERMATMNASLKQRHVVSNVRVKFTGDDTAVATAVLAIYQFADERPLTPNLMVDETNEMRRVNGHWLIAAKTGRLIGGKPPFPPGPPPPGMTPPGMTPPVQGAH
jgi:uncharacterized protein (TIGR02246 family)